MAPVKGLLKGEAYDQAGIERWVAEFWEAQGIYAKAREKSSRSPRKFYFLDGPPYTSSPDIHVGTAWNKVIKDAVLRYYRMRGYNVWDRPGFDTHGLPIEVKVEGLLGVKNKREIPEVIGVDRFVEECRRFAEENMKAQIEQFKELGVWMDWDNPYVTFKDEYIASGWWLFKRAHEQGLLSRDLRVVHWCPRCQTTLADYEVSEYRDLEDPSIYVKFPVVGREGEYLLIWTTTPWTLPANAFVMAHPDLTYVRVRVGGEVLILAKARLKQVMEEAGVSDYEVLEELEGRQLEGLQYKHPLEDLVDAQRELSKYHRVIMAPEAVSAHEGTGLVHAAPGHGDVDFEVARREGIPVVSLVADDGTMTREAGKYAGLYFRKEANEAILKDLRERGALFHESRIVHKYPVCWRCKTPLLLRATRQWVIRVSKLKDRMMEEAEKVEWKPVWAKLRYLNLLKELRDWIISRQRFWGTPLPIWVCERCGYIHVVGSVEELEKLSGKRPKNLHRPWVDEVTFRCPRCGGVMRRVPDVADVWFDSGIAFYASLGYPAVKDLWEKLKPVDFITEGHDQIRGWFFSLMRSGVIGFGENPYRRVLVHGFALDEYGREMHKSLGNYVSLRELLRRVPRDYARLWLLQTTTWEDLRFSWKGIQSMERDFRVLWNVFTFADTYMSLDRFDPNETTLGSVELEVEDRWLLSRLNRLIREYHRSMESMEPFLAAREIRKFIVEDVSHWYIRLVRRRVWVEEDTPSKRAVYATLYHVLRAWLLLAAPFIPFTAEYLYQKFVRPAEPGAPESVHLNDLPDADEKWIDDRLEHDMNVARLVVEAAAAARMSAGVKLRRPVRSVIVAPLDPATGESVKRMSRLIALAANAKTVEVVGSEFFENARTYSVEPNMRAIGPEFKKLSRAVADYIRSHQDVVARDIIAKGYHEASVEGSNVRIERRHVSIKAVYPEWLSVKETDLGLVAVDLRLGREEVLEGLAREIVRRIQFMRKEAGLNIEDRIKAYIEAGDKEILDAVKAFEDYIKGETRAVELVVGGARGYTKEWEIDGKKVILGIEKVGEASGG